MTITDVIGRAYRLPGQLHEVNVTRVYGSSAGFSKRDKAIVIAKKTESESIHLPLIWKGPSSFT